ncbi:MAG: TIGR03546 family protein [Bacteriovoracaceae bacterium]|nr:TIGR03546 family protein [Bacteriovoracaceae bacterium]
MTLLLKQIFALLKLINSETETDQIAWGLTLGLVLGMSPFLSLQTFLVLLCIFIFRVQMGAATLSGFFFAFVAYIFDPVFHIIGLWILRLPALQGLWTDLYNIPLVPLTKFNNTVVMGAGVVTIIVCVPGFFLFRKLLTKYRQTVVARFKQTKIWKAVEATSLYKWYYTYEQYN